MRKFIMAAAAAGIIAAPMAVPAQAEDTTVIKKDRPESTTVIKKRDDINVLPVPHPEEKKVIIHKDHDE